MKNKRNLLSVKLGENYGIQFFLSYEKRYDRLKKNLGITCTRFMFL